MTTTDPDGQVYWRSFEHLARIARGEIDGRSDEFPEGAAEVPLPDDAVSRRRFLGVVAAAVAMAGATACRKPYQKILPYTRRPHGKLPGVPVYYATALTLGGFARGVLVKSYDGRPVKVEGNERHPATRGGSDHYLQGELLQLYDPARSRAPVGPGHDEPRGEDHGHGDHAAEADDLEARWKAFDAFWKERRDAAPDGRGMAFLLPATSSPTLLDMVEKARKALPKARFHLWEPIHRDHEVRGAELAFGRPYEAIYDFSKATRILALDADFMVQGPDAVRHARDYAATRRVRRPQDEPSRLYVVESGFTVTGSNADHRLALPAASIGALAMALARELGVFDGALGDALARQVAPSGAEKWVSVLAKDLRSARGTSLVVAGPTQPPVVHALAHAINAALDNVGKTVGYHQPAESVARSAVDSIVGLAEAIDAGDVDTLVCLGTNPAFDAPADLGFGELLRKVPHKVHLGLYRDETGRLCDWHLNQAHELETWGDGRSRDGSVTIIQPLIAPLWGGVSTLELLARLIGHRPVDGYDLVRAYWGARAGGEDMEVWWRRSLTEGVVEGTARPVARATIAADRLAAAVAAWSAPPAPTRAEVEIVWRPAHGLYDGRYANNAWLQELPDPMTRLTWDNAASMCPRTAAELGVRNGDLVELTVDGRSLELPVWVLPGLPAFSIQLALGYGRRLGAECVVASGAGFDTYRLRGRAAQFTARGSVRPTGRRYELVSIQDHGAMEGRPLVREADLERYRKEPDFAPMMSPLAEQAKLEGKTEQDHLKSLWQERDYSTGYQWGMVIDLNACNGCNACVVACQAENNIPTVGKEQIKHGREMHWIRVDRYFKGESESPGAVHQPVPCMQCENAPCESVCPVAATTHSPEGLNDMVYNRCIGTRYCSNNCPYKVRRFNWFDFTGRTPETVKMGRNPDVTVRSRGVMEKCTYCVQRINQAKITARKEGRLVEDGEITPACAQACPPQAITFGNIVDRQSEVAKLRANGLNYAMLSELNVKPRTTYLAKIRNPHPDLL